MKDEIRVGVLVGSPEVPAWQLAVLESIAGSGFATLLRLRAAGAGGVSGRAAGTDRRGTWIHDAVERLQARSKRPLPDACARQSAERFLATSYTSDAKAGGLDVLLVLADRAMVPAELPAARLGHWYFTSAGRPFAPADGARVGLAEYVCRQDVLETTLEAYDPETGTRRAAYTTQSAIDDRSHYVNRNEHLWKCSTLVVRALRDCRAVGKANYLESLPVRGEAERSERGAVRLLLAFVAFLLRRVSKKASRMLFSERWVLMAAMDEPGGGEGAFAKLVPPAGRFWADPHVVEEGGRHHVFFEDAALATGIGHISVMSDDGRGRFGLPRPVLRKPYHLSYPFVFRWEGNWYMLPESAQNRTVELYRSVRFPDVWEPAGTLLENIEAFDSTLVEHGGRWWLFANVREQAGASTWDELHVFHADSPISASWQLHRRNPVVSDVRRARPAGRFYVEGGRLFRPSQNSSRRYGYALMINEVVELDESVYRERTVRTVLPREQRVEAIHSYSRAGRLTMIDAIRRELRLAGPGRRPAQADIR
jgi:hypothetical protein